MKNAISSNWDGAIGNDEKRWAEFLSNFYREEWDKLSGSEKAIFMTYKKQLEEDRNSLSLTNETVKITKRQKDFHIGHIPREPA